MSSLKSEITIQNELRPCWYRQERALFHCWEQISQVVAPSPMVGGHSGGVLQYTVALIELEDGTVREAEPTAIKFCDNQFKEYDFSK